MSVTTTSNQPLSVHNDSTQGYSRYLMWFRRDLRLHDNTALALLLHDVYQQSLNAHKASSDTINQAIQNLPTINAVFIVTPEQWLTHNMSAVQMDLIFRTLNTFASLLYNSLHINLHIIECATFDDSVTALVDFCTLQHITHVVTNAEYEVNEKIRDGKVSRQLASLGIHFASHHDQCIVPPKTVTTGNGNMYKVFTPFYNRWQSLLDSNPIALYDTAKPSPAHTQENKNNADALYKTLQIIDNLHTKILTLFRKAYPNDTKVEAQLESARKDYPAGEVSACYRLDQFITNNINSYNLSRDQPALAATSQLSAYLAIGVLSPRLCYVQAKKALANSNENNATDIQRWISELAWRDFYRHVIVERPDIIMHHAFKKETDVKIHWSYDNEAFKKWCLGLTGVPLVDAAMRCLNQTGMMHNRLRMVTAMFLTKDLLIDWRWGERYFMQNLIDGDFASNNGGWQWSSSTGTDAAPYFRIMNPFSQGKTHDKNAIFIKTWLPELQDVPPLILHDETKLRKALSKHGGFAHVDYPPPMVEHKKARLYAIEQFKK